MNETTPKIWRIDAKNDGLENASPASNIAMLGYFGYLSEYLPEIFKASKIKEHDFRIGVQIDLRRIALLLGSLKGKPSEGRTGRNDPIWPISFAGWDWNHQLDDRISFTKMHVVFPCSLLPLNDAFGPQNSMKSKAFRPWDLGYNPRNMKETWETPMCFPVVFPGHQWGGSLVPCSTYVWTRFGWSTTFQSTTF